MAKRHTGWENFKRMVVYRLIVPMKRSTSSPELVARGTAVGLAWAMTPLVGIQMTLVAITWAFCKKVLKWDFSLPLGLAWTWVTNVVTLPPIYYGFYVTGQIMRGKWENISGYEGLRRVINQTFLGELSFKEQWGLIFDLFVKDWGFSMCVGCLPWAVVFGFGGYYVTMRFMRTYHEIKEKRMRKRAVGRNKSPAVNKVSKGRKKHGTRPKSRNPRKR